MSDETSKGLPINRENMDAFHAWTGSVSEQARRALAANGPRLTAAFESFARAMRGDRSA